MAGPPAATVSGYEILSILGRGGMGVVYKARQVGLNRIVALKMILTGSHASTEDLVRFKIEAEAMAELQHPNIVQVYEQGVRDGRPFFSLEFLEGGSLDQSLGASGKSSVRNSNSPVPKSASIRSPWDTARLVEMIARALDYAAPPGHRSPRRQTGQHPAHARRRPQDHRLRSGQAAPARRRPDGRRGRPRHSRLHGPRASPGEHAAGRPRPPTSTRWGRCSMTC